MKVSRLVIRNFRGIQQADLLLPDHAVLIGDNNVGKSTVFEALNLVLGPDRLHRAPVIDEHDFHRGIYRASEGGESPEIFIEATVTHLNVEQRSRFRNHIEWWDNETRSLHTEPPPASIDREGVHAALRIKFIGRYNEEEDDFEGTTVFTNSDDENTQFTKKDKQYCGFLYLRSLRTGKRALSLEHGSLLDIILRLKEIRPQMWEKTIRTVAEHDVASDPDLGISGILESIERSIKKFVPKEWGAAPRLKVSNLTRQELRSIIVAFVATGSEEHTAPFYRQGTGTINLLVLALLAQIAEDKQNVVFAMEEPETAIPPYTQKRIIHEIRSLSSQALFTSHSPYVLEEFSLDETVVLSRGTDGSLTQSFVTLPESVKHKRYRQEFRTRFCEGLLSRRILIGEGATEAAAMPAAARRLSELNPASYTPLEALGLCAIDAGTDTQIADLSTLYRNLGKEVFAVCDKQTDESRTQIQAAVDRLFDHAEKGMEALVLKNTTENAIKRFMNGIELPPHIRNKYPDPEKDIQEALLEYFKWAKGDHGIADFLSSCELEEEIPDWIRNTCKELRDLCERGNNSQNDHGKPEHDEEDLA